MGIDKVSSCRISASESLMMPVGVYIDSFQAKPVQGGTLFEHLSIAPHQMYHGCSHLFVSLHVFVTEPCVLPLDFLLSLRM